MKIQKISSELQVSYFGNSNNFPKALCGGIGFNCPKLHELQVFFQVQVLHELQVWFQPDSPSRTPSCEPSTNTKCSSNNSLNYRELQVFFQQTVPSCHELQAIKWFQQEVSFTNSKCGSNQKSFTNAKL